MNYLQKKKQALLNYVSSGGGRLPSEYQEVEYIESSGTQYLTTDITPKATQTYYITYEKKNNSNTTAFGSRTSGSYQNSKNQVFFNITYGAIMFLGYIQNSLGTQSVGVKYYWTIDHINYSSNCDSAGTRPFYIFCLNNKGNTASFSSIKLYAFKITENGTDVLNLIPCYRKSDSEVGMYDTVSKTFLTNQGSGTFTKGQDV